MIPRWSQDDPKRTETRHGGDPRQLLSRQGTTRALVRILFHTEELRGGQMGALHTNGGQILVREDGLVPQLPRIPLEASRLSGSVLGIERGDSREEAPF